MTELRCSVPDCPDSPRWTRRTDDLEGVPEIVLCEDHFAEVCNRSSQAAADYTRLGSRIILIIKNIFD
jgi:hypothetical protein